MTCPAACCRSKSTSRAACPWTRLSRFPVYSRILARIEMRSVARPMAISKTAGLTGLLMKSAAESLRLSMAMSMSPWPVIMITSVSGDSCLTARNRPMPSSTGMRMSVMTMGGRVSRKTRSASSPLAAVKTS